MIKTPSSTVIGGAGIWTSNTMIVGSINQDPSSLIKSLFRNNEQGFAYDPNDLSTMFQDAAGTILVTGVGQPVGLIKDKSGRNNHAFQPVSASRPILQRNATTNIYYLAFDGVDDFLVTNAINFTATDKITLFSSIRKLSDSAVGIAVELSGNTNTNNGSFFLGAPRSITQNIGFLTRGSAQTAADFNDVAAPYSTVVTAKMSISDDFTQLRERGRVAASNTDLGTGNLGNHPLYIGRRSGTVFPFNGHIYSLIGISRLTTDSETLALEKAIAKLTGVTLNV